MTGFMKKCAEKKEDGLAEEFYFHSSHIMYYHDFCFKMLNGRTL